MYTYSSGSFLYTVQSGDTLWKIAQSFHTTIPAIILENPMLNENNLRIGQVIRIPQGHGSPSRSFSHCIIEAEQLLSNRLRLLWMQHVYWTRQLILSIVFGLPDAEFVTNRLLRNPNDFAVVLRELYGEDAVSKFVELFTNHLTIAAELVNAAKADNSSAAADAERRWYANANQIASFFNSINPYWSVQDWQKMLYDHLAMTKEEALHMLAQKYEDSIRIFENIEQEALLMADTMTQGVVKLFSQQFK